MSKKRVDKKRDWVDKLKGKKVGTAVVLLEKASVQIKQLPPRTLMNLHTELGSTEIEGSRVRFCQHINGGCFWLSVGGDLYQVSTEDLMNAVLNTIMEHRQNRESLSGGPLDTVTGG